MIALKALYGAVFTYSKRKKLVAKTAKEDKVAMNLAAGPRG